MDEQHPTAIVRLDRTQRAALRREIWIVASGVGDIKHVLDELDGAPAPLYIDAPDGGCGRTILVQWITELQRIVEALDHIGWREPAAGSGSEQLELSVSRDLAAWARDRVSELQESMSESVVKDEDLDALGALRLIGGAV